MKTRFYRPLIIEELLNSKYIRLHQPFIYYSNLLSQIIYIPTNFICDYESIPILKSSSKHAGVIHDYFCRLDSNPIVTKQVAASLYLEAQTYRDNLLTIPKHKKFTLFLYRHLKTLTVRIYPNYFHKHKVLSSLKELI